MWSPHSADRTQVVHSVVVFKVRGCCMSDLVKMTGFNAGNVSGWKRFVFDRRTSSLRSPGFPVTSVVLCILLFLWVLRTQYELRTCNSGSLKVWMEGDLPSEKLQKVDSDESSSSVVSKKGSETEIKRALKQSSKELQGLCTCKPSSAGCTCDWSEVLRQQVQINSIMAASKRGSFYESMAVDHWCSEEMQLKSGYKCTVLLGMESALFIRVATQRFGESSRLAFYGFRTVNPSLDALCAFLKRSPGSKLQLTDHAPGDPISTTFLRIRDRARICGAKGTSVVPYKDSVHALISGNLTEESFTMIVVDSLIKSEKETFAKVIRAAYKALGPGGYLMVSLLAGRWDEEVWFSFVSEVAKTRRNSLETSPLSDAIASSTSAPSSSLLDTRTARTDDLSLILLRESQKGLLFSILEKN